MTYQGQIKNGAVVCDKPISLPDGTSVEVVVPEDGEDESLPTLYERLKDVIGIIEGPPDLAENHDHYAHGGRKGIMKYSGAFDGLPEDASINIGHYLYGHDRESDPPEKS